MHGIRSSSRVRVRIEATNLRMSLWLIVVLAFVLACLNVVSVQRSMLLKQQKLRDDGETLEMNPTAQEPRSVSTTAEVPGFSDFAFQDSVREEFTGGLATVAARVSWCSATSVQRCRDAWYVAHPGASNDARESAHRGLSLRRFGSEIPASDQRKRSTSSNL